jgi:hypothetical protein
VVAGLEDLEGLLESRHGGGCVWWVGSDTKLRDKLSLLILLHSVVVVVGGRRGAER